ncbi:porin family protein [Arcicella rosea]|uniref:Outer membrane protein beta-barrel domain-containing protein n=1 Tax=Arcicella rosea TaxID=502909 RepID=A0A841EQ43_9BACT|nr:porin family protein [Arcicella rosea]MBB6004374.1 hypothetical protein [Arcicella rosea]
MKKRLFGLIVLAIISQQSFAQNGDTDLRASLQFGLKAGVNYSNVYDIQGENFKANAKFGFTSGAFVAVPFGTFLGIQPEFILSQKGFQATGLILGSSYDLTRTTTYLDIPLFFAFKPFNHLSILLGPQFSYLLKEKNVFTNTLTSAQQEKEFTNDNIRKFTLCYSGGADLKYDRFVLSARVGWDVLNNNGDGTTSTPQYKNVWFQATVGFQFL